MATRWVGFWLILSCVLCTGLLAHAWADVHYQLKLENGDTVLLSGINQKRGPDSLILYTTEYGSSTHTNPYGVEVSAVPLPGRADHYQVTDVRSVFECQKEATMDHCGNLAIPPNGIVLSAMGNQRSVLLKQFSQGIPFVLSSQLTSQSQLPVNVTNPTAENNPAGNGFPGFRGSNQLVSYTNQYGQPTTGTNEFGYEVTVKNGRVVIAEGANSTIPSEDTGFVLSGHGKARQWLLDNAPLGAKVELVNNQAISTLDAQTYAAQLDQIVTRIETLHSHVPQALAEKLDRYKQTLATRDPELAAQEAISLKQSLMPILWASYPSAPKTATKGIWHRPSENSLSAIRQSLDRLQKAGFNTVFLETYLHGDPIFPSRTFATYHIAQKVPFELKESPADYFHRNLLHDWITEAHHRGMKVHIWFQTFYAGNKAYDKNMGTILSVYPNWVNIQRSAVGKTPLPPSTLESGSYFLDPTNQDAQNFLLTLITEIVSDYDIDGFQLDYIRYPGSFPPDRYSYVNTTWGYTPVARDIFKSRYGQDPLELTPDSNPDLWATWNDFKTRQVSRFVEKAHDAIKQIKPNLPISAAVFPRPEESLQRKHQDWVTWAKSGWIDFLAPMTLTSSLGVIATDTQSVHALSGLPTVTGIFGPFNGNSPTEVVDQVWTAFSNGAAGVAVFDTAHLTPKMGDALHAGVFKGSTTKPVSVKR